MAHRRSRLEILVESPVSIRPLTKDTAALGLLTAPKIYHETTSWGKQTDEGSA
jgi:hypothetical protein